MRHFPKPAGHTGYVRGHRHGVVRSGVLAPYVAAYGKGGGKGTAAEIAHAMKIDWMTDRLEAGEPLWFGEEIEGYVWMPAPDGKIAKDQPVKERDDSMDAARYAVAHEDVKGVPRLRWVS